MRVVIAGGGLVGLALAALLRRRGLEPAVIERMPAGVYVRRGFMLGHQAYDAMDELGLLGEIRARGRAIGATADGGSAATAVEVGLVLAGLGRDVPVMHEHAVTELTRDEAGRVTGVIAEGPDGAVPVPADLVVACDGMRSRVRGDGRPGGGLHADGRGQDRVDEPGAVRGVLRHGLPGRRRAHRDAELARGVVRLAHDRAGRPRGRAGAGARGAGGVLEPPAARGGRRHPRADEPSTRSGTTSRSCSRARAGGRRAWS